MALQLTALVRAQFLAFEGVSPDHWAEFLEEHGNKSGRTKANLPHEDPPQWSTYLDPSDIAIGVITGAISTGLSLGSIGAGLGGAFGGPIGAGGGAVLGGSYGVIIGSLGGAWTSYQGELDDYQDAVQYWCNNTDESHEDYEETCEGGEEDNEE